MSKEPVKKKQSDKKVPQQKSDTLVVLDKELMRIQAVKGIDKNGKLETVDPIAKNQSQFMRIDKSGNLLSNFFSNFMAQVKNPSRFNFFKLPETLALKMAQKLQQHFDKPSAEGEKMAKELEISPNQDQKLQNESDKKEENMETTENTVGNNGYRFSREQIDWETLTDLGWSREQLEKYNMLDPLLKGYKTNHLLEVSVKVGADTLPTDGRLFLRQEEDGKVAFAVHLIRKEPKLNQKFFGHEFSKEDKENLVSTGNMGRLANLTYKNNDNVPHIISIDRLTNRLVALPAEWLKIPNEIKGVTLTEEQKTDFAQGKPIYLEGMLSKKDTLFNAHLQYNADKRSPEFIFDRNRQQLNHEVPKEFRGKELDDKQYEKLSQGHAVYIDNLIDRKGEKYQGYITFDTASGNTKFTFTNPELIKDKVQPKEENKTQVAVNSDGKTNESTKKINEPLKSGQSSPKNSQQKQEQDAQEEADTPVRRRGRRM